MAAELPEAIAVTARVAAVLESLGVIHLVGGSVASSVQGVPRSTDDADIVAALSPAHLVAFVAALEPDFFVDVDMIRDAIRAGSTFNIFYKPRFFKVDVFVAGSDEITRLELDRRVRVRVTDQPVTDLYLSTPEDTILQKLSWFLRGGKVSDRQWRDAVGVLRVQGPRLDRTYLSRTAARMGIADLLTEALEASDYSTSL